LRKIAEYFDDPELKEKVEAVIAREMPAVEAERAKAKARCEGKTAMLFVGGSRAHHYQELFREINITTIAASDADIIFEQALESIQPKQEQLCSPPDVVS